MSGAPTLSVCISTYNGQRYLQEQLDSISQQLVAGDEIVVVDDGSTDGTWDLLNRFRSKNSVGYWCLKNEKNLGPAGSFAKAASLAQGTVVVFSDQDDIWLPGRVERVRAAFSDQRVFLYHGNAQLVDQDLKPQKGRWSDLEPELYVPRSLFSLLDCFIKRAKFVGCMMAFRREGLSLAFYEAMARAPMHDLYLTVYAALSGKEVVVDQKVSMLYRRHPGTFTTTSVGAGKLSLRALRFRLRLFWSLIDSLSRDFIKSPGAKLKAITSSCAHLTTVKA